MMMRRMLQGDAVLVSASVMLLAGCATQPDPDQSAAAKEPAELILVAGASGRAGHFVVEHLREEGVAFQGDDAQS